MALLANTLESGSDRATAMVRSKHVSPHYAIQRSTAQSLVHPCSVVTRSAGKLLLMWGIPQVKEKLFHT